jgi:transcriptional regulator with XRE-family HTH domain
MSKPDNQEMLVRQRIAANMAYYRKLHNMTQSELAACISYSDKSISKWERAEGVPDIYVLTLLAELFHVTVNDLISENAPILPAAVNNNKDRVVILLLSVGLAWLVATIAYVALRVFVPSVTWAWYFFIGALPVSFIITVGLTRLWWNLIPRFLSVSGLVWSLIVNVYIILPFYNVQLVFAVGAVLQVLIILWFIFQKQLKNKKNEILSRYKKHPAP